jgi:two-component system response regulator NreC
VPHAKIIILTAHDHEEYVCEALRAGIHAYLLKSSSDETLVETIRSVHCGKRCLSPHLVDKVLREFELLSRSHTLKRTDFSEQELQLLELASRGLNTREISKRVYLSERTIKRRMGEVKDKLGARTRAQAVAEAIRRGLI